jgi:hypothetical protein
MPLQNFVDKVGPAISAAWLNLVDGLLTTVFGGAQTKADARAALGAAGVTDNNSFSGSNTFTGPTIVNHILGKSASYTVTSTDAGAEIQFSGLSAPATLTLPDAATAGFMVFVTDTGFNSGNLVTISRASTSTLLVNGSQTSVATYTLSIGERVWCLSDSFNWILISNQPRVIGLPSGGDQGPGTVNVQNGIYLGGSLVSAKSAASGYTRIGPNFCLRNDTSTPSGFANNACVSSAAPAGAKAVIIRINYAVISANAVGIRTSSAETYGDTTCTTRVDADVQSAYEFVATASGTVIAQKDVNLIAPVIGGNFYFKSWGNPVAGWPTYIILGYFD